MMSKHKLALLLLLAVASFAVAVAPADAQYLQRSGVENFEAYPGPSYFNHGLSLQVGPLSVSGGANLTNNAAFGTGTVYASAGQYLDNAGVVQNLCSGCSSAISVAAWYPDTNTFAEPLESLEFDLISAPVVENCTMRYSVSDLENPAHVISYTVAPGHTQHVIVPWKVRGVAITSDACLLPNFPFPLFWMFAVDNISWSFDPPVRIATGSGVGPAVAATTRKTVSPAVEDVNTITYPLGLPFFIQYEHRLANNTWVNVPATWTIEDTNPLNPSTSLGLSYVRLFPNNHLWYYGSTTEKVASKNFQTVHLGQAKIVIQPDDATIPAVKIPLKIIAPDSLGASNGPGASLDGTFTRVADESGIPPQFIKAQAEQESGEHPFAPRTWRYEALSVDYTVLHKHYLNTSPWSDYLLHDQGVPEGHFLCPFGPIATGQAAHDCKFVGIDDVSARSEGPPYLNYRRAGLQSRINAGVDVQTPLTIREIYNGSNSYYHFDGTDPSPQCGPTISPSGITVSARRRPSTPPGPPPAPVPCPNDLLAVTAQTPGASSYGIMQVVHTFALGVNNSTGHRDFEGIDPDHSGSFRFNPALLFDDPPSLAAGGGSIVVGTTEDARDYRQQNRRGDTDITFANPAEFEGYDSTVDCSAPESELWWMYKAYNGHCWYPLAVFQRVSKFLPRTRTPVVASNDTCVGPQILRQTTMATIAPGQSVTIGATMNRASNVSYQWYQNGTALPGSDDRFLTLSPFTTSTYTMVATNGCGTATSSAITVRVAAPCGSRPTILVAPQSDTIGRGGSKIVAVSATGASSYQWYVGAGPTIVGGDGDRRNPIATSNAPSITVNPDQTTSYWVEVKNDCGATLSSTATITVVNCVAPSITTQPSGSTISSGSAPLALAANGTDPVTITWKTSAGVVVGSGAAITVSPTATTSYYAVVSNGCGSVQSSTVTVTVSAGCVPPAITMQPAGSTTDSGNSAGLSLAASGTLPLTVTWKTAAGTTVGTGSSISVSPTATTSYYATVTNSCGSVQSATVPVTVNCLPRITVQPQSISVTAGGTATLSLTATGPGTLTVNWYSGGALVGSGTSISGVPTQTISVYALVSNSCGSVQSNTVTVTVNATCVPPQITTQPASATITSGAAASLSLGVTGDAPLTTVWKNAAGTQIGTGTTLAVSPSQTTSYYATVTNGCGSVQSNTITITVCHPPAITVQPVSETLAVTGQHATLSVTATGDGLTYQWYARDPSPGSFAAVSGATGPTLSTTPVNPTADYYVRVTGSCGTVNSATVTVIRAPDCVPVTISSQPQAVSVNAGQTATLSAAGSGSDPYTYQWMESTNGNQYSPASWGNGPTLYTTPPMTSYYYCMISNGCGTDVTNVVTVTVNGCIAPSVTTNPQPTSVQANHTATLTAFGYGGQANLQVWYTWYSSTDGVHFSEELWGNGTSLQVTPATTTYYFCRIGNYCRSVDTSVATVTVTP
jgi:hypothetical protein